MRRRYLFQVWTRNGWRRRFAFTADRRSECFDALRQKPTLKAYVAELNRLGIEWRVIRDPHHHGAGKRKRTTQV